MLATAAASLVVTVIVTAASGLRLSYRSSEMHVAIETAAALTAMLAALLMVGRFRAHRRSGDLILAAALALHGLASAVLGVANVARASGGQSPYVTWTAVLLSLAGTIGFLLAARADRVLRHLRRALWRAAGCFAAVAAACATAGIVAGRHIDAISVRSGNPNVLTASRPLVVSQVVAATIFFVAAAAFAARATRSKDSFLRLLAVVCVLSGFARLNYAIVPSLYSDRVFSGDSFRLTAYGVLLAAAFGEIATYWRLRAVAAALDERRRVARDLHDGLAQELAFIAVESRRSGSGNELLAAAADRALAEARHAIAALSAPTGEPFAVALERVVRAVPCRERIATSIDSLSTGPPDEAKDDLLRIAREAVVNASRHAGAAEIRVELTDRPLRLRIIDDGVGFDPATAGGDGHFGIAGMRARARRIGASISFSKPPEGGTLVEVALP